MIHMIKNGNIFDSQCDVLVCPVNCVQVMGAGLARKFAEHFPGYYKSYYNYGPMEIGDIHYHHHEATSKILVSLPTKKHWKNKAEYEYIAKGLVSLYANARMCRWTSIAIPALGCGLGGLDFNIVKKMIEKTFENFEGEIEIYEP